MNRRELSFVYSLLFTCCPVCWTVWGICLYMQMNLNDIPFLIHRVSCGVGSPFAAITASALLGRLSIRFNVGIVEHPSRSAFVRSQRCSLRFSLGLCAGQSGSSTPGSLTHVFMDLAFCTSACWNRKRPSPQNGTMKLSKICCYAEVFRVPFTGTKGPSPTSEEIPHHYPSLHQSLHLAQCTKLSWQPPNLDSVMGLSDRGAIPHSKENITTALHWVLGYSCLAYCMKLSTYCFRVNLKAT